MDYYDQLSESIKRVQQSKFCVDMLQRIHEHVCKYPSKEHFETEGYQRSQILADIRHLRRELLQLSRMI